jgi:hypothetical protein
MNYDYAADQLFSIAKLLKEFDSLELAMSASTLINIAAEVRKLAPRVEPVAPHQGLKPEPPRRRGSDPVTNPTPQPRKPSPASYANGA